MENELFHLQYAMDTFYFLICGALCHVDGRRLHDAGVGSGPVQNTTEILTKNVALYSIACLMYLVSGYAIMYDGGYFLSGIASVDVDSVLGDFASRDDFTGGSIYSGASDFFFQVVL